MPQKSKKRNRWLPHPPSEDATARIFLIPYSGCGASMYRRWPRRQGGVEFLPLELPGHETRFAEPTFQTYQELATGLVAGLAPHLDVPFGFFGHCASALAGYQASAELVRSGGPAPARLFVSSQVAPQDGPTGRFLTMDDGELAVELEKLIREMGGMPDAELVELYLEVMRADVDANKRYVLPDPPRLPCPITAIGWTKDDDVPHATMGGWDRCGDTTAVVLDGGHHRFTEAPTELVDLLCAGVGAGEGAR
ncbi:MAG TPA: alpha/beta fold hydrolase [Asanoa sp.]|nr:alpha/beta fold hydrolase [Asanoa sp.]